MSLVHPSKRFDERPARSSRSIIPLCPEEPSSLEAAKGLSQEFLVPSPAKMHKANSNEGSLSFSSGFAKLVTTLHEEQLQARITHYKAELETSPELDAITDNVIAQLHALQAQAALQQQTPTPVTYRSIEKEQAQTLTSLLGRVFRSDGLSMLLEHRLKDISRRVTHSFFERELNTHDAPEERMRKAADTCEEASLPVSRSKTIDCAEQGLLHLLQPYESRISSDVESLSYTSEQTKSLTLELWQSMLKDLRVALLSHRSPELKRILLLLNKLLLEFFQTVLPPVLPELATQVVQQSGSGSSPYAIGGRVDQTSFALFRQNLEHTLLTYLTTYIEPRLLSHISQNPDIFRNETLVFVQTPKLYTQISDLLCDSLCDFLSNEGFLNLPRQSA